MGGTALKRKARRNKAKSKNRKQLIKLQGFKPVIKSIDIEAIKAGFKKGSKKADTAKEVEVKETKVAPEAKAEVKTKEEKKPAKEAAPKAIKESKEPKAEAKASKEKKETKED